LLGTRHTHSKPDTLARNSTLSLGTRHSRSELDTLARNSTLSLGTRHSHLELENSHSELDNLAQNLTLLLGTQRFHSELGAVNPSVAKMTTNRDDASSHSQTASSGRSDIRESDRAKKRQRGREDGRVQKFRAVGQNTQRSIGGYLENWSLCHASEAPSESPSRKFCMARLR
jgi:hypothetical protein